MDRCRGSGSGGKGGNKNPRRRQATVIQQRVGAGNNRGTIGMTEAATLRDDDRRRINTGRTGTKSSDACTPGPHPRWGGYNIQSRSRAASIKHAARGCKGKCAIDDGRAMLMRGAAVGQQRRQ